MASVAPGDHPSSRVEAGVCGTCGERNAGSARFCQSCGTPLTSEATAAVAPASAHPASTSTLAIGSAAVVEIADTSLEPKDADATSSSAGMERAGERATAILERHGGIVRSGPGEPRVLTAAFGVLPSHGDGAGRAIRAVNELRDAVAALNKALERDQGMSISVRAGVATGEITGADPAGGLAALGGAAVTAAQRLQRAAALGDIVMDEATKGRSLEEVSAEPIPPPEGEPSPAGALYRVLRVEPPGDPSGRPLDAALVGRERELDRLGEVFDQTIAGPSCELVLVTGGAGLGTSRLASEFATRVRRDGRARVVWAGCSSPAGIDAATPLEDLLDAAAGIDEWDGVREARAKLERVVDGDPDGAHVVERIDHLLGISDGRALPEETYWAVRRFFEALARREPLVVVVEDLHLADPWFLHLVQHIVDRSQGRPMLVVATAHQEALDQRADWSAVPATSIPLEPLTDAESGELIAELLGDAEMDPETRGVITRSSGGNPLVLEQMTAMLIEEGLLRRDGARWIPTTDLSVLPPLPNARELLTARFHELDAGELSVVERAAVIGEAFSWQTLVELVPDAQRSAAGDQLASLVRKHLVRPHRAGPPGEQTYRFRHPSIREAAYEGVTRETKAVVHERLADRIERASGERTVRRDRVVGTHLQLAYRCRVELGLADEHSRSVADRAASRLAAAATRAEERGDTWGAAPLFDRASSLLSFEDPRRPALLLQAAVALADLGENPRVEALLTQAMRAARATGDRPAEWRAKVLRARSQTRDRPGQPALEEARRIAERATEIFTEARDDWGLAWVWALEAFVHRCRGHWTAHAEAAGLAAEHARTAGRVREESDALRAVADAMPFVPAPIPELVERCERLLERAAWSRLVEHDAVGALAVLEATQAHPDAARDFDARARRVAEDLGLRRELAASSARRGRIAALAGDDGVADHELATALEMAEQIGDDALTAHVAAALAHIRVERRRIGEALRLTELAEARASSEDVIGQVAWRSARSKAFAHDERPREADVLAREAVRRADQTDATELRATARIDLAETLRLAGRANEAEPFIEKALRAFDRKGAVVPAARARELLEAVRARASTSVDPGAVDETPSLDASEGEPPGLLSGEPPVGDPADPFDAGAATLEHAPDAPNDG